MIDAHHHFWDTERVSYSWMTDRLAPIRRPFHPEELAPLLGEYGVQRTVLVQTYSSVDETREFLELAASADFIAGVVGWVDLTDPGVGDTLAALRESRGGAKLVGIRHQVHDETDPDWLLRHDVQHGLTQVDSHGLSYDLLVRPRELPASVEIVRRKPTLRFVIDHLAKPRIALQSDPEWCDGMIALSRLENVSCKVSGLTTEASWSDWSVKDLAPFVQQAAEWFGEARLMLGSDWPVCLLAGSYSDTMDAHIAALGEISPTARERIVEGTAAEFYRL